MIVVPNHIIDQFAAEWLQLYPSANLLVATKKDFETKNRKKFCARIDVYKRQHVNGSVWDRL